MISNQRVTTAYHRLLEHFGDSAERAATDKDMPLDQPSEAVLMHRAVADAFANPEAPTTYLRAALELAALDQYLAESRERNVVTELRRRDVSWSDIAYHRGLRSAQAAQQRYERQRRVEDPEVVVYAFRDADVADAPWYGAPDALRPEEFQVGYLDFNPREQRPFSGKRLELRLGPAAAELMPPYLRAYPIVNGRAYPMTKAVQIELFGA